MIKCFKDGSVAEWLKAHAWKACVRATVPEVRILSLPPSCLQSEEPQSGSRDTRKIKNLELALVFFIVFFSVLCYNENN